LVLLIKNIFAPLRQKNTGMNCPKCKSELKVKSGFTQGRQRYKCKNCGSHYSVEIKSTAKSASMKKQALHLYLEGLGFRSIGRILGVSNVSVLNWIRSFGKSVEELNVKSKEIAIVDEMHSYIQSKKTAAGFGLLLTEPGKNSSTLLLATEAIQQQKSFEKKQNIII
jgi:transposase-like protein